MLLRPEGALLDSPGLGQASRGTPCLILPRISFHRLEGRVPQFCARLCGQNSRPVLVRSVVRELHGTVPAKVKQLTKRKTRVSIASGQTLPRPHGPAPPAMQTAVHRHRTHQEGGGFSFWLRKVISLAYQLSGKPLPSPSPLARETRGIAPSLLFKKNYAVSQVLKAGTWRRHTTFTRHYLRDLSNN